MRIGSPAALGRKTVRKKGDIAAISPDAGILDRLDEAHAAAPCISHGDGAIRNDFALLSQLTIAGAPLARPDPSEQRRDRAMPYFELDLEIVKNVKASVPSVAK